MTSASQPAEQQKPSLYAWNCRRCGSEQAKTDGTDLYFFGRKVPMSPTRVDWLCTNCKGEVKWRLTRDRDL